MCWLSASSCLKDKSLARRQVEWPSRCQCPFTHLLTDWAHVHAGARPHGCSVRASEDLARVSCNQE